MITTGIVRRIDELGRIVLPRGVRQELNIQVGDPLEIYLDKNTHTIALRKYLTDQGREVVSILDDLHDGVEGMSQEETTALEALLNHYYKLRGEA